MQTRKANGHSKVVELPGITGKGVAPVSIPEINKSANRYCRHRDEHAESTRQLTEAKEQLIKVIHKNDGKLAKDKDGSIVYRYEDQVIICKPGKDEVKVKSVHQKEK